jgi:hypothetical protein
VRLLEAYNINIAKGNYDTDFSNINEGCVFPSAEVRKRNKAYIFNKKLFTGEYAQNKQLVAMVNEEYTQINYKVLPLNYFELIVNKLDSLLFGNELTITTGDVERDKIVTKLIERVSWTKSIRQAVKFAEIYGDCPIKTGRYGVSVFAPTFAYKVVDISDKSKVKGYVLRELLYDKKYEAGGFTSYTPTHIRILISCCGYDYERVFEYKGNNKYGTLGKPVRYRYKDRWIPRKGRYYWTEIEDCETVQWLGVNTEKDGVYGSSAFDSIKELVFAIENRLSTENWVIDSHGKPLLLVGMSSLKTDEQTGEYYLSVINGKYMVDKGGSENKPEYLTWDGKLTESKQVRDDLMDTFYELSEMGKTFLSGEYQGNISEESLNNIIKSAIDRGNREVNDLWYEIRKSLYVLCRLNNINVKLEDINITFNVGRADDTKVVAEICEKLHGLGLFSKQTLLNKYFGYTEDDAMAEFERIKSEQGGVTNDTDGIS